MTTYKEGPVYAEVLFNMLDTAHTLRSEALTVAALRAIDWRFKGGCMVDAMSPRVAPNSESYFVDCTTRELLAVYELPTSERSSHARYRDYVSLIEILDNRKQSRPLTRRHAIVRCGTLLGIAYDDMGSELPHRYVSGLSAVYRVYNEFLSDARTSKVDSDMATYLREMVIASTVSSKLYGPAGVTVTETCVALLGQTKVAGLLHAWRFATKLLYRLTGPTARKRSFEGGKELLDSFDPEAKAAITRARKEVGDGVKGSDYSHGGVAFRVFYGVAVARTGSGSIVMGPSDIKRLCQMLMSTCSVLVAACAQASTGPPLERAAGATMVGRMQVALADMADHATRYDVGDEVSACKGLKKAFSAYMGMLSGPLCAKETQELVEEAKAACTADPSIVGRWIGYCEGLPAALAFNVGKLYKVFPAPDSAPGGVLIDRLKQTARPNAVDPVVMSQFVDMLTDQTVYARMMCRGLPRLTIRKGATKPTWWDTYRSGDHSVIVVEGLRNLVAWEGSTPMEYRDRLNPGIWKDSGLGADTLKLGLELTRDPRMSNMLTRMVFDPHCPMPGNEETTLTTEYVSKSDQKPESHKDPARSIFSAELTQRFKKSKMELTVGEAMREHPSFVIGASPTKSDERITACLAPSKDARWVAVYYSFDVAGWSPNMPKEPQLASHRLWGSLTGSPLWDESTRVMQGAKVYVNNGGYTGWYENGDANFEGYDGKEMTMINVAMLGLTVKRWRSRPDVVACTTEAERNAVTALLLAYIDDGMAKLVLPKDRCKVLFEAFKDEAKKTFLACGFSIEPSKCFPSDRFFIFLNESYLGGRHLVHGVRAAGQMCTIAPEKHESLVTICDKIVSGARGAVKAGLDPIAGTLLFAFHLKMEMERWVGKVHPVAAALWSFAPRAWGGLGVPNAMQIGSSTSGHAHVESISTFQRWAEVSTPAKAYYLNMLRTPVPVRTPMQILLNPFSARVKSGYMVDSRVADAVRAAMGLMAVRGKLGVLPAQFLKFGDKANFEAYANALVLAEPGTIQQAQLLRDLERAHPYRLFSMFTRRIEKASTVQKIVGAKTMRWIEKTNRREAVDSYSTLCKRVYAIVE